MRKRVLMAAGLMLAAALSWSSLPAKAITIAAPAALKSASDSVALTENVCWDCGSYYGPRPYYRPYYRPSYRSYYQPQYRPYYRPRYYSGYDPYYRPHRPYYRSYGGYGHGYGYYRPRPRFYVGPNVYWY